MKALGITILILASIIAVSYFGLYHYKWFAPKYENARREVFENTRSYNQAKLQELSKYMLEYQQATEGNKTAIASTIRHRFADYKANELPYKLEQFLKEIRGY